MGPERKTNQRAVSRAWTINLITSLIWTHSVKVEV